MRLMQVRGSKYWYVALPGRKRVSTKCEDKLAATLAAIQIERAHVVIQMLKDDAEGILAKAIAEHLNAKGHLVKDKAPVGARGTVYFVECPARGLIKIGFATDLSARIRTMRTSATDEIRLIGSFEGTRRTERALHARFLQSRKFGEWFEDGPDLRAYIDEKLEKRA